MHRETEQIINHDIDFFPLKDYVQIVEGNALELDWSTLKANAIVGVQGSLDFENGGSLPLAPDGKPSSATPSAGDAPATPPLHFDYIMGNPPFVGARLMTQSQKDDLINVFGKNWQNIGNMDYVSGWYKKAFDLIKGENTKCALVSTNSITQGEQVANLWKPLVENGLQIDFAYRTFRWDSESFLKAHVHCVIVGFSCHTDSAPLTRMPLNSNFKEAPLGDSNPRGFFIFNENGEPHEAKNINPYLIDAPNIFIESRQHPICDVPEIGIGNKPIDGGNYLFTDEEKFEFVKKEPESEKYFKQWYGSDEFINHRPRWCLWLGECPPNELRKMKHCLERVENVRKLRLASKSAPTQKLAETPTRFHVENMPTSNYLLIPEVSSEKRRYIPIGFMSPDVLCSNLVKIVPNATLYEFGVLTSSVHMAWTRAVCGRLKSDYRYSKDIIYNNFVWPVAASREVNNGTLPSANEMLRSAQVNNEKTIHSQRSCDIPLLTINCDAKRRIEQTAQAILDARAKYSDCSLEICTTKTQCLQTFAKPITKMTKP